MYCAPARIAMRAVSGSSTVPAPMRISPDAYSFAKRLNDRGRSGNGKGDFNRGSATHERKPRRYARPGLAIGAHDRDQSRFDDFS